MAATKIAITPNAHKNPPRRLRGLDRTSTMGRSSGVLAGSGSEELTGGLESESGEKEEDWRYPWELIGSLG
jgi:hypothetical protein